MDTNNPYITEDGFDLSKVSIEYVVRERMRKYHEPIVNDYGWGVGNEPACIAIGLFVMWVTVSYATWALWPLIDSFLPTI